MARSRFSTLMIFFLAATLSACALPFSGRATPISDDEIEISVLMTVDAFVGALTENAPSATVSPSATATPTLVPPMAVVEQETICWSGPVDPYEVLAVLEEGEIVELLGFSEEGDYLVIASPDNREACWMLSEFAVILVEGGNDLEVFSIPPTPTPSPTATPAIIWDGEWTTWVGPLPLTQYMMILRREGTTISGSFEAGDGIVVTLIGTVSEDLIKASGTWSSSAGAAGSFVWERGVNINQFVGHIDDGDAAWCGAREGASQPSPCHDP